MPLLPYRRAVRFLCGASSVAGGLKIIIGKSSHLVVKVFEKLLHRRSVFLTVRPVFHDFFCVVNGKFFIRLYIPFFIWRELLKGKICLIFGIELVQHLLISFIINALLPASPITPTKALSVSSIKPTFS